MITYGRSSEHAASGAVLINDVPILKIEIDVDMPKSTVGALVFRARVFNASLTTLVELEAFSVDEAKTLIQAQVVEMLTGLLAGVELVA